jgi:inner membrane transporter RhtA
MRGGAAAKRGATRFTPAAQVGGRSVAAPALVIAAVVSVQCGSAAATTLFDQVGPAGAVLYRLLFAAILLLAVWRPAPLEAGREGLLLAVAFGVTLAGMNFCFYEALDRIDLGIAVTFEFVGPLLVGLLASRRALDLVWVGCAATGVLLLTRPSGSATAAGIGFALLAGAFWAAYILLSARVGRAFPGGRGLALAMGIAAVLMLAPGTAAAGGDLIDPGAAAIGAATAVLSSVIPYSLELEALRRIAVGTFGVLMSMEPAVAALIGLVALGQGLAAVEVAGIALVVVASAGVLGASVARAPTEA